MEKEDENNNKSNILTKSSTETITNFEQHGDYIFIKNRIYSKKKSKIFLDKDKSMDKEFKELLEEEEENNDENLMSDSDIKKINTINNIELKEKIKKYLNKS